MAGAGYEDQMPEGADQDAHLRDAFAQLLMMQQLQQQQQNPLPGNLGQQMEAMTPQNPQDGAGLPPYNGRGEQGMQPPQSLPPGAGAILPGDAPKAPDGPPMAPPTAGAASDQDMKILEDLMRKSQRQGGGTFSLPPSARRFDI